MDDPISMSLKRSWNLIDNEESPNGHTQLYEEPCVRQELDMSDLSELTPTLGEPSSLIDTRGDTTEGCETYDIEGQVCFGMVGHNSCHLNRIRGFNNDTDREIVGARASETS